MLPGIVLGALPCDNQSPRSVNQSLRWREKHSTERSPQIDTSELAPSVPPAKKKEKQLD
jgi:hypothetical protein